MPPFRTLTVVAAPLLRDHVDTDSIIPSREIKSVGKRGLAAGLFAAWRYRTPGTDSPGTDAPGTNSRGGHAAPQRDPDPQFVLNQTRFAGAGILLSGENFGCGSSREHAVWALAEQGFRAIIAASFAPIFYDNCINNGVLAICLPRPTIAALAEAIMSPQGDPRLTIDLDCQEISGAAGVISFGMDADARLRLLEGLDAIDLSLRKLEGLDDFYRRDRQERPWVYL